MTLLSSNLLDQQKTRDQKINQCVANRYKNQNLNSIIPIINSFISAQRVSMENFYSDSTILEIGSIPWDAVKLGQQPINKDQSITDMNITDFTNQDITEIVAQLDLLKVWFPFGKNQIDKIMSHKMFGQRIPAKAVTSEDIQRYTDKIQIVAIYEDVLKPTKEFPINQIIDVLNQVLMSIDLTDMSNWIGDLTNYDISNMYYINDEAVFGIDQSQIISSSIRDFSIYLKDFTNLFQDKTIIDGTDSYVIGSHFDISYLLFRDNITGDATNPILSYIVPFWFQIILSDQIPNFFKTRLIGENEQISERFGFPYGTYIRDILKFYYCFDDNLSRLILLLIMAWIIKSQSEDNITVEVAELLQSITGTSTTDQYIQTNAIKNIETQISNLLTDITSCSEPVIYHTDYIDITTDVTISYNQTLDDIYTIIDQLNTIQIIYIIDMGYIDDLNMNGFSVMVSKDRRWSSSGLLSFFSGINYIQY